MYLDQVNYELNKKINDFVCNSNDATTPEERIDILNQAWELLPKPATQFVEPTSAIACGISGSYKKLGDYQKALEWMLVALEARKDEPAAGVFIWTGIVYYELILYRVTRSEPNRAEPGVSRQGEEAPRGRFFAHRRKKVKTPLPEDS